MDVRLVIANPNSKTRQIRLRSQTLVGRSSECQLRIASGQVSRRHCLLMVTESEVKVRDLGSVNGTQLNGKAIPAETDVRIEPGTTLTIGPMQFIVQYAAPKGRADEDTDWLPLIPDAPRTSREGASAGETLVLDSVPGPEEAETKDGSASQRRVDPAAPPLAGRHGHKSPEKTPPHKSTDPSQSSAGSDETGESVLDFPQDPANQPADRQSSETHLVFEEEDLEQMQINPNSPSTPNQPKSPPADDDLDDQLKDFLSGP
jgi:pSer/pThr/pTyr-binding forkhead associated (FHA) protein